jgi:hypothetical protein
MQNHDCSYMTNAHTTYNMTKSECWCLPEIGRVYWTIHVNENRHVMSLSVFFTFCFLENIMIRFCG